MGLLYKTYVDGDCILGCWKIEETTEELEEQLHLSEEEIQRLISFKTCKRKKEWLSVRALLKELCNANARICYLNNKPFLEDRTREISISHSNELTCMIMSKTKKVGIDIEYISDKIERIQHRFINEKENINIRDQKEQKILLYLHWSAKEAIYKIHGKKKISFKENIFVNPFKLSQEGQFYAHLINGEDDTEYRLTYKVFDDYVVVWSSKENNQ